MEMNIAISVLRELRLEKIHVCASLYISLSPETQTQETPERVQVFGPAPSSGWREARRKQYEIMQLNEYSEKKMPSVCFSVQEIIDTHLTPAKRHHKVSMLHY